MYTHTGAREAARRARASASTSTRSGLHRCQDGWIVDRRAERASSGTSCCITCEAWDLLADETLSRRRRVSTGPPRSTPRSTPWLSTRTADEAIADAAGQPGAGRQGSNDFHEVLASEQLADRDGPGRRARTSARRREAASGRSRLDDPDRQPAAEPARRSAPTPPRSSPRPRRRAGTPPARRSTSHDVRVAEFSIAWAGPLTGRFLADLGAEVIKVEHPAQPRASATRAAPG